MGIGFVTTAVVCLPTGIWLVIRGARAWHEVEHQPGVYLKTGIHDTGDAESLLGLFCITLFVAFLVVGLTQL